MKLLNTNEFNITIDVYFEPYTQELAASTIRPIHETPDDPESSIDEQALADYYSFIDEVEYLFGDYNFKVVDENTSNKSVDSKYYKLAIKDQWDKGTAKYTLNLRISEHEPKLTSEGIKKIRDKNNEFKHKYHVKYKVKRVIVNSEAFDSYESAEEYVEDVLEYYEKLFEKHPKGQN